MPSFVMIEEISWIWNLLNLQILIFQTYWIYDALWIIVTIMIITEHAPFNAILILFQDSF